MPKRKQPPPSQEEQSNRFRETVSELVAAGDLDPGEADAAFARLMDNVKKPPAGD